MEFPTGGIYDSTNPKVFYVQEANQPVLVENALSLLGRFPRKNGNDIQVSIR